MTRHPELPERDRRILGRCSSRPTSTRGNQSLRCGSPAAASVCPLPRCGTSWPGSKSRASFGSRTHQLGEFRPTSAIAATWISFSPSGERRAPHPRSRRGFDVPERWTTCLSHVSQEVSRAHRSRLASPSHTAAERPPSSTSTSSHSTRARSSSSWSPTGGQISHKVIEPSERYAPVELQQAANYLNSEFRGRSMADVRQAVLERLREERTLYDALLERALRLASSTFDDMGADPVVFIQGTSLLLEDIGC